MYRIGIDIGSTYTKYCVMDDDIIISLFSEKTPIRQRVYFKRKAKQLCEQYPGANIISCGYGKANVDGIQSINELTALAKGAYYSTGENACVLDIGGQDTKIIRQEKGQLKEFFVNDKCAAGSGMFLTSVLDMLNVRFADISLSKTHCEKVILSSTCAVFAQSEIVALIADNKTAEEIESAVIAHILIKSKSLLSKMNANRIRISGGLSQILSIGEIASIIMGVDCLTNKEGMYYSAIGCALSNKRDD